MTRALLIAIPAWIALFVLVATASQPDPVRVIQSGPHLWHVVGEQRSLIRADDGLFIAWCDDARPLPRGDVIVAPSVVRLDGRFVSSRDDVDFTLSLTCPTN